MDGNLTILCSLGGVLNGLAYQGGLTQVLLVDRNISFLSLHNLIIDQYSIDYEFILVHIFVSNCINVDSEDAWKFVLEVNAQSPYINIYVTPPPSMNVSNIPACNTFNAGPSSSHQVIPFTEEEHVVDDINNDDENSDDLIENLDDEFDDSVDSLSTPELFIGKQFENRSKFRSFISDLAIRRNFTCSATLNNATGIIYKCSSSNCHWRVYAKAIGRGERFSIATLENIHSCLGGLTTGSHPLATTVWVKNQIIDKIRDNQSYSPSCVVKDIFREHRIHIKYCKAWKARELALSEINGSYIDAYSSLEEYGLRIIETNPGSQCFMKITENNRFERIFILLMLLFFPLNIEVFYLLLVLMILTINYILLHMLLLRVKTLILGIGF
ncbi:uncharacterized protein M6B38_139975 [Iris pallida]|uniref:Transposase MuDR plant domain-containing protein n=1 Tax=Iris pallida TaxID=29817 RepID=A0AAX6FDG8_IRIPA|nr:uncharacterized protein M6B38_139975 [Iris pallida]